MKLSEKVRVMNRSSDALAVFRYLIDFFLEVYVETKGALNFLSLSA